MSRRDVMNGFFLVSFMSTASFAAEANPIGILAATSACCAVLIVCALFGSKGFR